MIDPRQITQLDEAIRGNFVLKYGLIANFNGNGVYEKQWSREDLDFVRQWEMWLKNPNKRAAEFDQWKRMTADQGIIVRGLNDDKNKNFIMLGLAGLAGFGLHWMMSGKSEEKPTENSEAKPSDLIDTFVKGK